MELREWKYINNPTANIASAASTSSNTGFKKRLDKLIKYHGRHPAAEVEYILVGLLTKDKLEFAEHYDDGQVVEYKISIDPDTEAWEVKRFVNNQLNDTLSGTYWISLLKTLSPYLTIPVVGTPEYKDILHEWVVMNNSTTSSSQPASVASSKTNKEKFTELVSYMQKHKDSSVIFTSVNGPNDTGFEYEEQRAFTNGDEYNLNLEVECKSGNLFFIHLDMDGKRIATKSAVGWEDLLLKIKTHFHVPKMGSSEYKSLTESLSMADYFRVYENLWEDVDIEEYNIILGKTSYDLYNDYELESYLTQSAKLMRKPLNTEKPLEFFKLQKVNKMLRTPKYYENKKLAAKLQKVKSELEKKLN